MPFLTMRALTYYILKSKANKFLENAPLLMKKCMVACQAPGAMLSLVARPDRKETCLRNFDFLLDLLHSTPSIHALLVVCATSPLRKSSFTLVHYAVCSAMIGVQSLCIGSVPLGHLMGMRRCWGPVRKMRSPPLGVESIFAVPVRWVYQECGT